MGALPFVGVAANGSASRKADLSGCSGMGVGGSTAAMKDRLIERRCLKSMLVVDDPRILCRLFASGAGRSFTKSSTGAVSSRNRSSRWASVARRRIVETAVMSICAKKPIWSMRTPKHV